VILPSAIFLVFSFAFLMEEFFLVIFLLCSSAGGSRVGDFSTNSDDCVDLWLVLQIDVQ
jgi:hypothetical protein